MVLGSNQLLFDDLQLQQHQPLSRYFQQQSSPLEDADHSPLGASLFPSGAIANNASLFFATRTTATSNDGPFSSYKETSTTSSLFGNGAEQQCPWSNLFLGENQQPHLSNSTPSLSNLIARSSSGCGYHCDSMSAQAQMNQQKLSSYCLQKDNAISSRVGNSNVLVQSNSSPPSSSASAAALLQQQQQQQQPKNPKLYKTELCRSWMDSGRCNYGERCQYAHGEHEKRPIPRHPKYKTEACQSYHKTGYCPYGPRCHFIHNEEPHVLALISSGGSAGQDTSSVEQEPVNVQVFRQRPSALPPASSPSSSSSPATPQHRMPLGCSFSVSAATTPTMYSHLQQHQPLGVSHSAVIGVIHARTSTQEHHNGPFRQNSQQFLFEQKQPSGDRNYAPFILPESQHVGGQQTKGSNISPQSSSAPSSADSGTESPSGSPPFSPGLLDFEREAAEYMSAAVAQLSLGDIKAEAMQHTPPLPLKTDDSSRRASGSSLGSVGMGGSASGVVGTPASSASSDEFLWASNGVAAVAALHLPGQPSQQQQQQQNPGGPRLPVFARLSNGPSF